jgi:hypothetical protein
MIVYNASFDTSSLNSYILHTRRDMECNISSIVSPFQIILTQRMLV